MKLEKFQYELGEVMSLLTIDSRQDFGQTIDVDFLKRIITRYKSLNEDIKKRIEDDYIWFMDSYNFELDNNE